MTIMEQSKPFLQLDILHVSISHLIFLLSSSTTACTGTGCLLRQCRKTKENENFTECSNVLITCLKNTTFESGTTNNVTTTFMYMYMYWKWFVVVFGPLFETNQMRIDLKHLTIVLVVVGVLIHMVTWMLNRNKVAVAKLKSIKIHGTATKLMFNQKKVRITISMLIR